jgi:hypothetical protein
MAKEVKRAQTDFNLFRNWNLWLAAIFFVQAVAIAVAGASRPYPITLNFLGTDTLQSQAAGHTVLATGTHRLFDLNLTFVVAAFLLVAAVGHALAATKLRSVYEQGLQLGINKIRWTEYSVAAGIMMVAVAMLVGVQDIATLLCVFGLIAVASLLGLIVERWGKLKTGWMAFSLGCLAGGFAWIVIAIYLFGTLVYGTVSIFSWVIALVTILLFIASGVNLYLQQCKFGNWASYLYSEKMFMALSLAMKTLLAWLIFADVLHP